MKIIKVHFVQYSAGAISSAIATPTDVLKVRMQVHGRGTDQVGLIGCFREIYQHEGISGLWRVITWIRRVLKKNIEHRLKYKISFVVSQGLGPTAQRGTIARFEMESLQKILQKTYIISISIMPFTHSADCNSHFSCRNCCRWVTSLRLL